MAINIRPAGKDDAESLVKLNEEFNGVGITVIHVTESIENSNELIAIAEYDDRIVGFACAQSYASFMRENWELKAEKLSGEPL